MGMGVGWHMARCRPYCRLHPRMSHLSRALSSLLHGSLAIVDQLLFTPLSYRSPLEPLPTDIFVYNNVCVLRGQTFYVWVEWWNLYFYESVCLWLCVRYLWLIRIRTSRTTVCESLTQIRTHCFKLQNISTCKRSWLWLPFTKLIACPNP